jgi:hypothetical protein
VSDRTGLADGEDDQGHVYLARQGEVGRDYCVSMFKMFLNTTLRVVCVCCYFKQSSILTLA